jgi:hypothetical protein
MGGKDTPYPQLAAPESHYMYRLPQQVRLTSTTFVHYASWAEQIRPSRSCHDIHCAMHLFLYLAYLHVRLHARVLHAQ